MKEKLFRTTLLASLLMSGLASAEEITPEKGADLLIWTDKTTVEYMEYAADSFNKEFGYDVDFSFRGLAPIDSASRLIQDGGSARVADVAEIEHDLLGRLVVAGGAMENLVSAERIDSTFMQNAISASKSEGVSYGFPVSFATTALFYNKDLLPKAPESFEEIIEFSKSFNNKQEHKYALLWDIQNYYESRMFVTLYGAYEFGNNGTDAKDIGIDSEEAQKGLEAMKSLRVANSSNPIDMRNPQVRRGLFGEGKVGAIIDGPWAIQGYKDSGVNFGVVPMPKLEGQQPRTFSTVRLAVVSSYTEYPRAAQLFADYLSTEAMLKKRYQMTQSIPPVQAVMEEIIVNADEATYAIITQGFYSDAMPSLPEMGFIWSPMASAITDLWVNDKSPKAVLDRARSIITEQIELQE
ncbi:maltose ABC transporter substrate-binding protein [Vibrio fortis]|uniref:Maltodextrin-binding protein n=1 Tax=Vibrio fortis TaxID=212667 RepID=A0A066UP71_9VIBR|nr:MULTISPECIES: maltose ABC transporter substrate-binding protein [Vibrio]KAB0288060.1 maltose ABC transporter substrate-binding protein [Vibrio fortis]KAB0301233.1 maltose ABC transporter substrate-binding protein [Vibrio fortis]KDN29206.1 sugar ABC transporter substrate-binding protein [Vibrio fortis]MDK9761809.1 maltose ABC transporter substrate-binding protein [Vibrio sp. D420a]QFT11797.1 Cyclodextrin-binding protein precursor [Vibrio sp. THAF190c]|tara:strand:- start:784 stop:2010 length:1227 start_codon:yes stop_codon:yes gene_type:complete